MHVLGLLEGRGEGALARAARDGRARGQGRPAPLAPVRRAAAARRHRPGAGHAAQGHAVRRGDLGARPGGDRRGDERHPPPGRGAQPDDADGHAPDGLRQGDLGPRLLLLRRQDRGAGAAARSSETRGRSGRSSSSAPCWRPREPVARRHLRRPARHRRQRRAHAARAVAASFAPRGTGFPAQARDRAADRRLQAARRDQRRPVAARGGGGRHLLLDRQSRPRRRLCGARAGPARRRLHVVARAAGEGGRRQGARRRGADRRPQPGRGAARERAPRGGGGARRRSRPSTTRRWWPGRGRSASS